jgi:hypothetical protein
MSVNDRTVKSGATTRPTDAAFTHPTTEALTNEIKSPAVAPDTVKCTALKATTFAEYALFGDTAVTDRATTVTKWF